MMGNQDQEAGGVEVQPENIPTEHGDQQNPDRVNIENMQQIDNQYVPITYATDEANSTQLTQPEINFDQIDDDQLILIQNAIEEAYITIESDNGENQAGQNNQNQGPSNTLPSDEDLHQIIGELMVIIPPQANPGHGAAGASQRALVNNEEDDRDEEDEEQGLGQGLVQGLEQGLEFWLQQGPEPEQMPEQENEP